MEGTMKKTAKNEFKPIRKLVTGAPPAVVMSILIHIGLFVLAAAIIVVTIPPKDDGGIVEVVVQPTPPVMPLPPLQMPAHKSDDEPSAAVITADVDVVSPEDIQMLDRPPGTGTIADKLGGVVINQKFDWRQIEPNHFSNGSPPIGTELIGVYYDFKRSRSGNYNGAGANTYREAVRRFLNGGWDTTVLSQFYRAQETRKAPCVMLPTLSSSVAPTAFGEDPGSGTFWMVHYKGTIVYPEDITFRFWGVGDEFVVVRLNEDIVFADVWPAQRDEIMGSLWHNTDPQAKTYLLGHNTTMEIGDWVTLKANEPLNIEIAVGDNGGLAALMLLVEVEGVDYPLNRQGGPILPAFKTAELSHDLIDLVYKDLPEGEANLIDGPVFNDLKLTDIR
jgi:hypothetical protein